MRIKELGLTALGVLSLFWPWMTMKPFVDYDVDEELERNVHLAKMPQSKIDDYRKDYGTTVQKRLHTLRFTFWGSFLFLLAAVIVAKSLASYLQASPNTKTWLGGLSIFVFAWATLARLGKMSFGGVTSLERIDLRVMWVLYWIGTLLGTLALI